MKPLTELEAWQRIRKEFSRYARTGRFPRYTDGLCIAVYKLSGNRVPGKRLITQATLCRMMDAIRDERPEGADTYYWPRTRSGDRCRVRAVDAIIRRLRKKV